ncbi:MAG: elongation factor P [Planctomycetota bacterium]|nr:elongation factor P [Planctomycetota bacterium]
MLSTNELKKGVIIEYEGAPCAVETVKVSSPTARGGNTITRVRLRNLRTKMKLDVSFRGGENFAEADFEKRPVQMLYVEKGMYHFMDQENYEQFGVHEDDLEWERGFIKDDTEGLLALRADEELLGIELPNSVTLTITDTPPAIKGASVNARTKPATLETGLVVKVPEHIDNGEAINVDTRTGDFLGRA